MRETPKRTRTYSDRAAKDLEGDTGLYTLIRQEDQWAESAAWDIALGGREASQRREKRKRAEAERRRERENQTREWRAQRDHQSTTIGDLEERCSNQK